jgi:hypothetical protein
MSRLSGLRFAAMAAPIRPWLIGLAVLVVVALGVLILLAFANVGDGMHHLDHLAGKAWKGD